MSSSVKSVAGQKMMLPKSVGGGGDKAKSEKSEIGKSSHLSALVRVAPFQPAPLA
jgi:hypothetical protein